MNSGWIKISRSIQENWIWQKKPFSKGQAWIDLILMANHQDGKLVFADHVEKIPRGSLVTSQHKLAKKWGWTRGCVNSFLFCLKSDNMIDIKTTTSHTTISLINYDNFQLSQPVNRQDNRQATDHEPTTSRPRTDTNKNIYKNDKNEKNNKGATIVPSEQEQPNEDDDGGWVDADDLIIPERFYKKDV